MTALIRWARVLVCLMATGLVLVFGLLVRAIVRDWRLAGLATFAFAFSGGMQFHLRMLRSEMLAAGLVVIGLLFLLLAARRATNYRPLLMGAAAFLCVIGYENKVHVVFLIAALPIICLMFGTSESGSTEIWTTKPPNVYAFCATLFIASVAAVLFVCAFLCSNSVTRPVVRWLICTPSFSGAPACTKQASSYGSGLGCSRSQLFGG